MSTPIPDSELPKIYEALLRGQKIEAIRLYRQCTGSGLAEAKAAVENLKAKLRPMPPAQANTGQTFSEVEGALFQGQKILAIKRYRQATGVGLADAKMTVERIESDLRSRFPERFTSAPAAKGCLGMIAIICALLAVVLLAFVTLVWV